LTSLLYISIPEHIIHIACILKTHSSLLRSKQLILGIYNLIYYIFFSLSRDWWTPLIVELINAYTKIILDFFVDNRFKRLMQVCLRNMFYLNLIFTIFSNNIYL